MRDSLMKLYFLFFLTIKVTYVNPMEHKQKAYFLSLYTKTPEFKDMFYFYKHIF